MTRGELLGESPTGGPTACGFRIRAGVWPTRPAPLASAPRPYGSSSVEGGREHFAVCIYHPPTTLGAVSLGANFVFRTVEIPGADHANSFEPPFEGQMLTVVGFKLRYVNQVVVQHANGYECLLRLYMVEKALRLKAQQVDIDESGSIHPPSTFRTI